MNNLLIEVTVLISLGWATTFIVMKRRWQRQQQAWQWWHTRQASLAHFKAESIRDGLLQQTFAFRRYLETAGEPTGEAMTGRAIAPHPPLNNTHPQNTQWIEKLQTFHQSLEGLSNDLSPPFLEDSFPLALQFTVKAAVPSATLLLPAQWDEASAQQNQSVLSVVTELISLLKASHEPTATDPLALRVELKSVDEINTLTVQLDNACSQTMSKILEMTEIQHLKEIFHSLVAGQLDIRGQSTSLIGCLRWPKHP